MSTISTGNFQTFSWTSQIEHFVPFSKQMYTLDVQTYVLVIFFVLSLHKTSNKFNCRTGCAQSCWHLFLKWSFQRLLKEIRSVFSTEHFSLEQHFKASANITDDSERHIWLNWTEAKIINSNSRTGGWKLSWMNALTSDKTICFRQTLFHVKKEGNCVLCCG